MSESTPASHHWLDLLQVADLGLNHDPALLGQAIRRWATLAAAAHRAESVTTPPIETVSLPLVSETVE